MITKIMNIMNKMIKFNNMKKMRFKMIPKMSIKINNKIMFKV